MEICSLLEDGCWDARRRQVRFSGLVHSQIYGRTVENKLCNFYFVVQQWAPGHADLHSRKAGERRSKGILPATHDYVSQRDLQWKPSYGVITHDNSCAGGFFADLNHFGE